MNRTVTIYALIDPRDPFRVRYVGKSSNPTKRLGQHIVSRFRHKSHKNDWVNSLIRESVKPVVVAMQECSLEEWEKWERFWIAHFKSFGLVNSTDGGDVVCDQTGYRHTDDTKRVISMSNMLRKMGVPHVKKMPKFQTGFSAARLESIRKAGLNKRGIPMSPAIRRKCGRKLLGRKLSESTKAKLLVSRHNRHPGGCYPSVMRVRCLETGEVFKSTVEAAKVLGVSKSAVGDHLRGRLHSVAGRHLERFRINTKAIRCIETGEEFGTVRDVVELKGISDKSMRNVLCNATKTAGGFHWEKI